MQLHSQTVQLALGVVILRIIWTLHLCVLGMYHEIQLLFTITTIALLSLFYNSSKLTLDVYILFCTKWWGLGILTLVLAKASGDFLAPPLYKTLVGNFIRPAAFRQKYQNSDIVGQAGTIRKSLRPTTKGHVLREQHCPSNKDMYPVVPTLCCTS